MGRGRGRGGSRGGMNKGGMNDDEDFYDEDMGVSQFFILIYVVSQSPLDFFSFPVMSCPLRLILAACSHQLFSIGLISTNHLSLLRDVLLVRPSVFKSVLL